METCKRATAAWVEPVPLSPPTGARLSGHLLKHLKVRRRCTLRANSVPSRSLSSSVYSASVARRVKIWHELNLPRLKKNRKQEIWHEWNQLLLRKPITLPLRLTLNRMHGTQGEMHLEPHLSQQVESLRLLHAGTMWCEKYLHFNPELMDTLLTPYKVHMWLRDRQVPVVTPHSLQYI